MWRSAARRSSQIRRLLSSSAPQAGAGAAVPGPCIVHKRGNDILHDPWYNKVGRHPIRTRGAPRRPRSRGDCARGSDAVPSFRGARGLPFHLGAGHGVPHDGARPPRPPGPAPAAGHVLRAAVRAIHKLVPVAGEQHAGRTGFHRRAGQVEDPQQAARPERDIVLQGANRQHQGFCTDNIHSHCRLGL